MTRRDYKNLKTLMERQLRIIAYLLAKIVANQSRIFDPEIVLQEAENYVPISKTAAKKNRKFRPPTVDELTAYMKEKNLTTFSAQDFIDFYESKGWMIGKNKMTSWKSAAGRWERNNKNRDEQARNNTRQVGKGDYYGETLL